MLDTSPCHLFFQSPVQNFSYLAGGCCCLTTVARPVQGDGDQTTRRVQNVGLGSKSWLWIHSWFQCTFPLPKRVCKKLILTKFKVAFAQERRTASREIHLKIWVDLVFSCFLNTQSNNLPIVPNFLSYNFTKSWTLFEMHVKKILTFKHYELLQAISPVLSSPRADG